MSRSHNKKRNVGLIYEFLVRGVSMGVVADNPRRSNQCLRLIKRYFRPGSELHKEFRLVNALMKTTVSSDHVAASIISDAKIAARSHDVKLLDREKSLLISSINKSIHDETFYDQVIPEYRMLATVQTLVNDWRDPNADLSRVATYEDQLARWLVTPKAPVPDAPVADDGSSRLLMKVMMKRLNEKYSGVLTPEQKQLFRAYAFSTANDDPKSIRMKLSEVRECLLERIGSYLGDNDGSEYVNKKLLEVKQRIESETLETVDDAAVMRFMLYAKLNSELSPEGT